MIATYPRENAVTRVETGPCLWTCKSFHEAFRFFDDAQGASLSSIRQGCHVGSPLFHEEQPTLYVQVQCRSQLAVTTFDLPPLFVEPRTSLMINSMWKQFLSSHSAGSLGATDSLGSSAAKRSTQCQQVGIPAVNNFPWLPAHQFARHLDPVGLISSDITILCKSSEIWVPSFRNVSSLLRSTAATQGN